MFFYFLVCLIVCFPPCAESCHFLSSDFRNRKKTYSPSFDLCYNISSLSKYRESYEHLVISLLERGADPNFHTVRRGFFFFFLNYFLLDMFVY